MSSLSLKSALTKLSLKKSKEQPKENVIEPNPNVADMLAPDYFDDSDKNYLYINRGVRTHYFCKDYDSMVKPKWGSFLHNQKGTITTILCRPADKSEMAKRIDYSDARNSLKLAEGGSASDMERTEREREHGRTMLRVMGDDNEVFYDTCIFETLCDDELEHLKERDHSFANLSFGSSVTVAGVPQKQQDVFFAASPYWVEDEDIYKSYGREICCSTIAASDPFCDNSCYDPQGTFLGHCTADESIWRVDMTHRTAERESMNVWLSGKSGSGKTTAAFCILQDEYARGAKIIALDCERTMKAGCKNAGGQWINAGGGMRKDKRGRLIGACFSPLQPRLGSFSAKASDNETVASDPLKIYDSSASEDIDTDEVLRNTLSFIHSWANIVWDITGDDTTLLDHALLAAYADYGISYDTRACDLVEDHYPVMDDLKRHLDRLEAESKRTQDRRRYHSLALKVEQCCVESNGVYANLWGYRTNVSLNSDFIVFDTYELTANSIEPRVKIAQLFSVLTWIWGQACITRAANAAGKNQFLRIFIDEGHHLFGNSKSYQSTIPAEYINMLQKQIRKYGGGLMFATQALVDVLDDSVKKYGESLITSSTYRFFFHTEADDLKSIGSKMNLTEHIKNKIAHDFGQGDCLFMAGKDRVEAHVDLMGFQKSFWSLD